VPKSEYSGPWKKVRLGVLERDGYLCQIRGPKCTINANHVDHIIPASQGGAWFDTDNLRAACAKCNLGRVDRKKDSVKWQTAKTKIVLVMGPPGSGKTTYVQANKDPDDLVVDYDALASALGGLENSESNALHDAVSAARNSVLRLLRNGEVNARRAWIISANAKADTIFPFHSVKVVDPGIDEIRSRAGVEQWRVDLAVRWYAERSGQASGGSTTPSRTW